MKIKLTYTTQDITSDSFLKTFITVIKAVAIVCRPSEESCLNTSEHLWGEATDVTTQSTQLILQIPNWCEIRWMLEKFGLLRTVILLSSRFFSLAVKDGIRSSALEWLKFGQEQLRTAILREMLHKTLSYILHFLAAIAALQFTMSAYQSVCPQWVLWKCYAVVSIWLLLLLLKFMVFEYSVVIFCILHLYFASLDANAAL